MTEANPNIEIRAIESLLEDSYIFEVPLQLQAQKPSKLTRLLNKLGIKLDKGILKGWEVEAKEHTDPKTGEKTKQYVRKLQISPLYLGTIDNIRKLFLTISYDEKQLKQDPLLESRKLFKHINTMTEIAAIATLNTSPTKTNNYKKALNELKHFYKEHLKPSSLLQLIQLINFMSNQADFTNSIRLTQMTGTTAPKANLIE